MHTPTIVTQVMQCCLPLMHATRWRALHDVVVSSVNGHALSLVALAVGTPRTISVRHRVKCVDRLLGNENGVRHDYQGSGKQVNGMKQVNGETLNIVSDPNGTYLSRNWLGSSM